MPCGCDVLLQTKQRGRKRGRMRGGKARAPSITGSHPNLPGQLSIVSAKLTLPLCYGQK